MVPSPMGNRSRRTLDGPLPRLCFSLRSGKRYLMPRMASRRDRQEWQKGDPSLRYSRTYFVGLLRKKTKLSGLRRAWYGSNAQSVLDLLVPPSPCFFFSLSSSSSTFSFRPPPFLLLLLLFSSWPCLGATTCPTFSSANLSNLLLPGFLPSTTSRVCEFPDRQGPGEDGEHSLSNRIQGVPYGSLGVGRQREIQSFPYTPIFEF